MSFKKRLDATARKLRRIPRNFELLRNTPKSKSGISIIVATLLLIVIAVAASVIIFSFIQGFVAQTTGTSSAIPIANLVFLGALNFNNGFSSNTTVNGQVTLVLRNHGDAVTVDSVSISDTQGTILQLAATYNATPPAFCSAGQDVGNFQVFADGPGKPGCTVSGTAYTVLATGELSKGSTSFITVNFGTTTLGAAGFSGGDFQNFKIALTNGFIMNAGSRVT